MVDGDESQDEPCLSIRLFTDNKHIQYRMKALVTLVTIASASALYAWSKHQSGMVKKAYLDW